MGGDFAEAGVAPTRHRDSTERARSAQFTYAFVPHGRRRTSGAMPTQSSDYHKAQVDSEITLAPKSKFYKAPVDTNLGSS